MANARKSVPKILANIIPKAPLSCNKNDNSALSGISDISSEPDLPNITHIPTMINTRQNMAVNMYNHLYRQKCVERWNLQPSITRDNWNFISQYMK